MSKPDLGRIIAQTMAKPVEGRTIETITDEILELKQTAGEAILEIGNRLIEAQAMLYKRLANLLSIKSLVTLVLTGVFAYLTCAGGVTADQFLTVFTVVIAFYFGTQAEKNAGKSGT